MERNRAFASSDYCRCRCCCCCCCMQSFRRLSWRDAPVQRNSLRPFELLHACTIRLAREPRSAPTGVCAFRKGNRSSARRRICRSRLCGNPSGNVSACRPTSENCRPSPKGAPEARRSRSRERQITRFTSASLPRYAPIYGNTAISDRDLSARSGFTSA